MAVTGQIGEVILLEAAMRERVPALPITPCQWKSCPSARGTWRPSRGLRSRDGANPEKKIAKNFSSGVHKHIVGEVILEVKATTSAERALSYSKRAPSNVFITSSLPVLFMPVP